jgi:hypothetical protein
VPFAAKILRTASSVWQSSLLVFLLLNAALTTYVSCGVRLPRSFLAFRVRRNAAAAQKRKGCVKRSQTHCKFGHPLSGENLYLTLKGYRVCRKCHRERSENPAANRRSDSPRTAAITAGQPTTQFCGRRTPNRVFGFNKLKSLRQMDPFVRPALSHKDIDPRSTRAKPQSQNSLHLPTSSTKRQTTTTG